MSDWVSANTKRNKRRDVCKKVIGLEAVPSLLEITRKSPDLETMITTALDMNLLRQ